MPEVLILLVGIDLCVINHDTCRTCANIAERYMHIKYGFHSTEKGPLPLSLGMAYVNKIWDIHFRLRCRYVTSGLNCLSSTGLNYCYTMC